VLRGQSSLMADGHEGQASSTRADDQTKHSEGENGFTDRKMARSCRRAYGSARLPYPHERPRLQLGPWR
jgi:hypothetical protein